MAFGLWEQDPLVASQYASISKSRVGSPERRLLAAVLMDAVEEFQEIMQCRHRDDDPRLCELRAWFFAHDETWPFAFENVCSQLDLNPDGVRARLATLAKERPVHVRRKRRRLR